MFVQTADKAPNPKLQIPEKLLDLGFYWNLDFGIWIFSGAPAFGAWIMGISSPEARE
jgi:hypothetical protein